MAVACPEKQKRFDDKEFMSLKGSPGLPDKTAEKSAKKIPLEYRAPCFSLSLYRRWQKKFVEIENCQYHIR
jgi:hypothetical protein